MMDDWLDNYTRESGKSDREFQRQMVGFGFAILAVLVLLIIFNPGKGKRMPLENYEKDYELSAKAFLEGQLTDHEFLVATAQFVVASTKHSQESEAFANYVVHGTPMPKSLTAKMNAKQRRDAEKLRQQQIDRTRRRPRP